jgi:hypothetical protein
MIYNTLQLTAEKEIRRSGSANDEKRGRQMTEGSRKKQKGRLGEKGARGGKSTKKAEKWKNL